MYPEEIKIQWRGTVGMGDCMMALNCAHTHAWNRGCKINLEMHWDHGEDYYHHFEEEETIIERMEYIHNFYLHKDNVRITHKYDQRGDFYYENPNERNKLRYIYEDNWFVNDSESQFPDNGWIFDIKKNNLDWQSLRKINLIKTSGHWRNKVVIWRPLYNAEKPRTWKRLLTNDGWNVIISTLRSQGFNVVELGYRTPIREALFHLRSCRQVICYDGMWHYIAKNLGVPMLVVSEEGITSYHTPNALKVSHSRKKKRNIWKYLYKIHELLGESKKLSKDYMSSFDITEKKCSLQDWADEYRLVQKDDNDEHR